MPIKEPDNIAILETLDDRQKAKYRGFTQAMERATQQDPSLDTAIYTEFLRDWLQGANDHRQGLDTMRREAIANGRPMTRREMAQASQDFSERKMENFMGGILPQHGESGQRAWQAFDHEMKASAGSGGIVGQFYNKHKGGPQWGGIGGAIIGGLLGSMLGGGLGSWMGIVAIIVGVLAGSWLGNKTTDLIGGALSGGKGKGPAPQQQPGQVRQPESGLSPDAQRRREAAERAAREGQQPSQPEPPRGEADLGGLPPPATGPQAQPQEQTQGQGQGTSPGPGR